MYEVKQYASNELPPEIDAQIASFIRIVWAYDRKGEDRFPRVGTPKPATQHFVIAERGVLISHVNVIHREITHMGERYRLYGLRNVFTYPAFRGEGHGRQIVNVASAYILKSDADAGMLFTGIDLFPFYQVSGWTALQKTGVYYGDPDHPQFKDAPIMLLYVSDHAKAHRDDFEQGNLFVGESLW